MKKLFLASILCLRAQDKTFDKTFDITPAEKLKVFPVKPLTDSVWGVVQGLQDSRSHEMKLTGIVPARTTGICSVPLTEVRVSANIDPRIATKLNDSAVPIRQANVPTPACSK